MNEVAGPVTGRPVRVCTPASVSWDRLQPTHDPESDKRKQIDGQMK